MLDLDITVFYTIIILWVLLIVLNRIFYKPVGKIIDEREKKSEADNTEIEMMKTDIEKRSTEIEFVLKKARRDSINISEKIIKSGELARDELLTSTRKRAGEDFKEKMISLGNEIDKAEGKLKDEIGNFSKKIEELFS